MEHMNFVIPSSLAELLSTPPPNTYYVRDVVIQKEILTYLENAKIAFREEGIEAILTNFDAYYSVVHHANALKIDVIFLAYKQLLRGTEELIHLIDHLLSDKDNLSNEMKHKVANILKMFFYIFSQIIQALETKLTNLESTAQIYRSAKKKSSAQSTDSESYQTDRKAIILAYHQVVEREINMFWDPPVVEESFAHVLCEVGYMFLRSSTIKNDKQLLNEIFSLFGQMLQKYQQSTPFVLRLVQMVRIEEHMTTCLPQGLKLLMDKFNCQQLVHNLIQVLVEDFQCSDGKAFGQAKQGDRNSSVVLSEMATLMPEFMLTEVTFLYDNLPSDSPPFRIAVLNVMTEILLSVLNNSELTEEQCQSRDDFLLVLMRHINDGAAAVRTKSIQNWIRLQKEAVIPRQLQCDVLDAIIFHLKDTTVMARKAASVAVTEFMTHNPVGGSLEMKVIDGKLLKNENLLKHLMIGLETAKLTKLQELEEEWSELVDPLHVALEKGLSKTDQQENAEEENEEIPNGEKNDTQSTPVQAIRQFLREKRFDKVFRLLQMYKDESPELLDQFQDDDGTGTELDIYMVMCKAIFMNYAELMTELKARIFIPEDIKAIQELELTIGALNEQKRFVTILQSAVAPMANLLDTINISDMHEAINFFVQAYHFRLDNVSDGILEVMKLMKRDEPDRRIAAIEAFKGIYLKTQSTSMTEHTLIIIQRLFELLRIVKAKNVPELQRIVSEWVKNGYLDNNVLNKLWELFLQKTPCSADDSCAAAELLQYAAIGRRSIITKNIEVVTSVAFSQRALNDLRFMARCCHLLAVLARDRIDITSDSLPPKMPFNSDVFKQCIDAILSTFLRPLPNYNPALSAALKFIYALCNKPEAVVDRLLDGVSALLAEKEAWPPYIIARFCHLIGCVANRQLSFLDGPVYLELKRRNYCREKRAGRSTIDSTETVSDAIVRRRRKVSLLRNSAITAHNESLSSASITTGDGETVDSELEGAQGADPDADFILNVLENDVVTGSGSLAKLAHHLIDICQNPNTFNNEYVQGNATIALIRFMLVSNKFCEANIRLLFTILDKTAFEHLKCTILLHLNDLLTRFPNVIEPWTAEIFKRLMDESVLIRRTTFYTLSNLILNDMIRVHGRISKMVVCMVDTDEILKSMCNTFFSTLANKENNLCNALPDIFSHLMTMDQVTDDELKSILKFLFKLMSKPKHSEKLIDRFCVKIQLTDKIVQHRHIVYCLSLIQYNEKALKSLLEQFPVYKHLLNDKEVHNYVRQILANSVKAPQTSTEMRTLVAEMERRIEDVFKSDGNTDVVLHPKPPQQKGTTRKQTVSNTRKQPPKQKRKGRSQRLNKSSSSSSDSEASNQ